MDRRKRKVSNDLSSDIGGYNINDLSSDLEFTREGNYDIIQLEDCMDSGDNLEHFLKDFDEQVSAKFGH